MTVKLETAASIAPFGTNTMATTSSSTKRLPFQPKSSVASSNSSCSSGDDYGGGASKRSVATSTTESSSHRGGGGHRRLSSGGTSSTNREYDVIASNGPLPSSYREPSTNAASAPKRRPALERASSAPEHVLRQSMDPSSFTNGDEVIIEEKRRRMKGGSSDASNGYTIHRYRRGKLLGKGGFAKVYMCTALDTGKDYAVKIVPKANLVKTRARQKVWLW